MAYINNPKLKVIGTMMLIRAKNNLPTSVALSKLIVNCAFNGCYYIHYDTFGVPLFYVLWREITDNNGKKFAHILDVTLISSCHRRIINPLLPIRWKLPNIITQRVGRTIRYHSKKTV